MVRSASRSASETGSVGGRLRLEALGGPAEVRQEHVACRSRGPLGQLEVGAHQIARTRSTSADHQRHDDGHVDQEAEGLLL